jgi:anaerobic selenocysteine-containing dehydrogenase
MDRRNFFKIISATGVLSTGCGSKTDKLIPLLVREHEIAQGEELWRPAVCTECSAGCGTIVRIMEAERVIERGGEQLRERIAAIKKIEGNPLDPVSGGHLCARGQASVQSLYHPDRLRGPMKRTGDRGKAQFTAITWDEAIAAAAEGLKKAAQSAQGKIVFVTGPLAGSRSVAIGRFAEAFAGRPVICSVADHSVERKAAEQAFGWEGLPVYDLANAHFALGVGADFLGGWVSLVYYTRQFGNFRQGREQVRGRLVQAESRLSVTASAADKWLPLRPGTEAQFLGAVGRMLLDGGMARNREKLPKGVVETFASVDVGPQLAACGLDEKRVRAVVEELGKSAAGLVLAGASVVYSNSLDAVVASHYINLMLGNVGKPGGVLAPAAAAVEPIANHMSDLADATAVLIDGANPAYLAPRSAGALSRAQIVISFSPFLDDSAAFADLLLPDHHALESMMAVAPAVAKQRSVAISAPFVAPLYDTRAVEQSLSDIARKAGTEYTSPSAKDIVQPLLSGEATYDDAVRQGGLWLEAESEPAVKIAGEKLDLRAAEFAGDAAQYPYQFQPYVSLQFHEGSGANLPWMQELPDPASSSIWGLPVEIDPKTAASLRVSSGDIVRVESPHGSFEAPAYVHPGAVPQVVSMAIGDGHTHYGRYASGRGANPLSILAPVQEKSTGAPALGGTRIKLSRVGGRKDWIQFSTEDREEKGFGHR